MKKILGIFILCFASNLSATGDDEVLQKNTDRELSPGRDSSSEKKSPREIVIDTAVKTVTPNPTPSYITPSSPTSPSMNPYYRVMCYASYRATRQK